MFCVSSLLKSTPFIRHDVSLRDAGLLSDRANLNVFVQEKNDTAVKSTARPMLNIDE